MQEDSGKTKTHSLSLNLKENIYKGTGKIHHLLLTPNNKGLFASEFASIYAFKFNYETKKYEFITTMKGHTRKIYSLIIMQNPKYMMSACKEGFIIQWNTENYQLVSKFNTGESNIVHAIEASNGDILTCTRPYRNEESRISVWNRFFKFKRYLNINAYHFILLKDGRILVGNYGTGIDFLRKDCYDIEFDHRIKGKFYPKKCNNNAFFYDEKENIAIIGGTSDVKIIDINNYTVIKEIGKIPVFYGVHTILRLPNKEYIVGTAYNNANLGKYNADFESLETIAYPDHKNEVRCAIVIPGTNSIILGDITGNILLWEGH